MSRIRRRAAVAIVAGLLLGAVIAVAGGSDRSTGGGGRGARTVPVATPLPNPARLPDGRYSSGYVHLVVDHASAERQVALRDPESGPGWAVRTFAGERRTLKRSARTLAHPAWRSRVRCVQLVRTHDGRPGWVFGDGRFRPIGFQAPDAGLGECGARERAPEIVNFFVWTTLEPDGTPRPRRGVLWGLAPPRTREVVVDGLGGAREVATLDRDSGAFLLLSGPDASDIGASITYRFAHVPDERHRLSSAARPVRSVRGPVPGTETVEARTPDPAGGPPWGVLVADRGDGGLCVAGATQVIGDRPGVLEPIWGRFYPAGLRRPDCRPPQVPPTRKLPVVTSIGSGSGEPPAGDVLFERARRQRRIQPGRFTVYALCHPDVERVTLRSPRDVRTLIPSPRAHVIYAIYDGDFRAGELQITAHLRGGGTYTDRFELGF